MTGLPLTGVLCMLNLVISLLVFVFLVVRELHATQSLVRMSQLCVSQSFGMTLSLTQRNLSLRMMAFADFNNRFGRRQ
jgi:hypothetical protein